jgi:hypothetical protein
VKWYDETPRLVVRIREVENQWKRR